MITIVMVDDNKDITKSVKDGLEDIDSNMKVVTTNYPKKALSLIQKKKPNLIILDVMMPGLNGWELGMKLKGDEKCHDIPIIYLTAIDDSNCRRLGLTIGVDYLQKPFSIETLHSTIKKHIVGEQT